MATAPSFDSLLTPEKIAPDAFRLDVPDGWQQGRGAFGGLLLGTIVRAVESFVDDRARAGRSITAQVMAPVAPGASVIRVEELRRGNAVSTLRAVLEHEGDALVHAVVVAGRPRPVGLAWKHRAPPPLTPWREVPVLEMPPGLAPVFTQHFEYRNTGAPPFFGADEPAVGGWIRPRIDAERLDDAYIVALADAWWPAGTAVMDGVHPFATIAFTLDIVGNLGPADLGLPLFHKGVALESIDGYMSDDRELWTPDGRLIALNHQTMVIIK
jgi:hypothetical protein